jgi:hypothetical protein
MSGHNEFKWYSAALNNIGCIHIFVIHEGVIILAAIFVEKPYSAKQQSILNIY